MIKDNQKIRKKNILNVLFYSGFIIISLSKMMERSALIQLSDDIFSILNVFGIVLFLTKLMLDQHNARELLFNVGLLLLMFFLKLSMGMPLFMLATCCGFMAIKGVDIRIILKIDIVIKTLFLIFHSLIFALDYISGTEMVFDFIDEVRKGTVMSLYFVNPNSTGLIGVWIAIEILFLKENKKWFDYIAPTMFVSLVFIITTSRTPFFVYVVYLALQFIKSDGVLTIIQKLAYPFFCTLSFMMVSLLSPGTPIYDMLNALTSGRIGFSFMAYNLIGPVFLPDSNAMVALEKYPIDVFYIKCLVNYGIITMIIAYIPHFILPTDSSKETKRISIIASLYLFFEAVLVNIGFAPAYLILADAIINKEGRA